MSNSLLRGLAVTFGAGLAFGIGTKLGRNSTPKRTDSILDLEPLVDRLDTIEDRIQSVEKRFSNPAQTAVPAAEHSAHEVPDRDFGELDARLSAQTRQLEDLRGEILTVESRSATQVAAFREKLSDVEAKLPAQIEASIGERISALEQRLQADFQQTHSRTVDMFVQTIESKVVQRISALEQSLAEHSHTIFGLREKSLSTDENLQKLLAAVEKLCNQTAVRNDPSPKSPPPPSSSVMPDTPKPFSLHLATELSRVTAPVPTLRPEPPPPPPTAETRTRGPLALSILAISLSLLGIRFSR
ncbi:MAG: hypothetical protein M3Z36_11565 [Acidobacteriota bacterium]|nr:hypothetical protein [Acidobacteriota bacterium]